MVSIGRGDHATAEAPKPTQRELDEMFELVQAAYPAGCYPDSDWKRAKQAFVETIRRGKATDFDLLQAARAYCSKIQADRDIGTRFVKWPSRFFNSSDCYFRGPFIPSSSKAKARDVATIEEGRKFINGGGSK